jgi:hypothetical protein
MFFFYTKPFLKKLFGLDKMFKKILLKYFKHFLFKSCFNIYFLWLQMLGSVMNQTIHLHFISKFHAI